MFFPLSSTALSPSLDKPSERGWRAAAAPAHRASSCAWPRGGRNATLQQARDPAGWVSAPTKCAGVAWDQGTVGVTLKKPFCLRPATGNPSGFAVEWRADPSGHLHPHRPPKAAAGCVWGPGVLSSALSELLAGPEEPFQRGAALRAAGLGRLLPCSGLGAAPSRRRGPGGIHGRIFCFFFRASGT